MENKKRFLKMKEAAEYADKTLQTLRNWEKSSKLVPKRHQINNERVYDTEYTAPS